MARKGGTSRRFGSLSLPAPTWWHLSVLVVLTVLDVGRASAATKPMECADSPFPADTDGYIQIPFRESSTRFPSAGTGKYQNNIDYRWQAWFSGNVTSVKVVFQSTPIPGFNLE